MTRNSLRGKRVGRCSGSNAKADANQTQNQELVVPDNPPVCLTHSRRYWSSENPGECEVKVEIENWGEPEEETGPMVILEMRWTGAWDCPDEWTIRWVHYLGYLGYTLPGYLCDYSPATKEMLYQLISGLEPKYADYFEPVAKPEGESTEVSE